MNPTAQQQPVAENPVPVDGTSSGAGTMSSDREERGFNTFETWKYYEQVAMHFNDLLMRLRTSSLGAVAAFTTIAGVVLKNDARDDFRWSALAGVFLLLAIFWGAIWLLDFLYYNRLLIGAVDALLEIESTSERSNKVASLVLSRYVERAVAKRESKPTFENSGRKVGRGLGRWCFYSTVFVALLAGFLFSLTFACTSERKNIPTARAMGTSRPATNVTGDSCQKNAMP